MRLEMQAVSGSSSILPIIVIAVAIAAFIIIIRYRKGSDSLQKKLRGLQNRYMKFNVKHVPAEEATPETIKETDMKPLLREQPNTQEPAGSKKEEMLLIGLSQYCS